MQPSIVPIFPGQPDLQRRTHKRSNPPARCRWNSAPFRCRKLADSHQLPFRGRLARIRQSLPTRPITREQRPLFLSAMQSSLISNLVQVLPVRAAERHCGIYRPDLPTNGTGTLVIKTQSGEQNPDMSIPCRVSYTITLSVSKGDQKDSIVRKNAIIVSPPRVIGSFTAFPLKGPAPLKVRFTNTSVNALSCVSSFGPSAVPSNSSEQNPAVQAHTRPGTYMVSLTAG